MFYARGRLANTVRQVALLCALGASAAAQAAMAVSTQLSSYEVEGTNSAAVVDFLMNHPFEGDHGEAWATIHPNYDLSVSTVQRGAVCRANVDLAVTFSMTLPEAADRARMSGGTRALWDGFAFFARNHEAHHRALYLGCASRFVDAARRQTADSCFGLDMAIHQMFDQSKQDCEGEQAAFDRQQHGAVMSLPLFRTMRR
jgi:predicted secreted Zn-dependent protease